VVFILCSSPSSITRSSPKQRTKYNANPTASPSGENNIKERAGRDGEIGSASASAKEIVARRDSWVALTASDSFS
jgi:hypothetical protein